MALKSKRYPREEIIRVILQIAPAIECDTMALKFTCMSDHDKTLLCQLRTSAVKMFHALLSELGNALELAVDRYSLKDYHHVRAECHTLLAELYAELLSTSTMDRDLNIQTGEAISLAIQA
jgi:hypothetical protein